MKSNLTAVDKVVRYSSGLGAALAVCGVIALTALIAINVVLRLVFNAPLPFAEEFAAYLVILVAYMGLAHTARVGAHIRVDLIVNRLPQRLADAIAIITIAAALALASIYLVFAFDLFLTSLRSGATADTIVTTPLWIPQIFLWLGLVLFVAELASDVIRRVAAFADKRAVNEVTMRTRSE